MHIKIILLLLFVSINSSCVSIPDYRACTVAGTLSAGADCATANSGKVWSLSLNQYLDFLTPSDDPKRGGAICTPAEDFTALKTALEQACKKLGNRCVLEIREEDAP